MGDLKRQNVEEVCEPPKKQKYGEGEGSEKSENEGSSPTEELAECVNKFSLTPNDEGYEEFFYHELKHGKGGVDEMLPLEGATEAQRPDFVKIWMNYDRQIYNSNAFDIHDWPCGSLASNLVPILPTPSQYETMMELAKLAIQRHNVESAFKYKVLKIEKVNYQMSIYYLYHMTVKVLNVTLGTVIETFRILAAKGVLSGEKIIADCRPKEGVSLDIVHHGYRELTIDVTHEIVHED